MSSTKLTPATNVSPAKNQGYWNPKNALQTHALIKKSMPPPRNTIVECDDRSLGFINNITLIRNTKIDDFYNEK